MRACSGVVVQDFAVGPVPKFWSNLHPRADGQLVKGASADSEKLDAVGSHTSQRNGVRLGPQSVVKTVQKSTASKEAAVVKEADTSDGATEIVRTRYCVIV